MVEKYESVGWLKVKASKAVEMWRKRPQNKKVPEYLLHGKLQILKRSSRLIEALP